MTIIVGYLNSFLPDQWLAYLLQVLDEFSRQVNSIDIWESGSPTTVQYTGLDGYLAKYQVR